MWEDNKIYYYMEYVEDTAILSNGMVKTNCEYEVQKEITLTRGREDKWIVPVGRTFVVRDIQDNKITVEFTHGDREEVDFRFGEFDVMMERNMVEEIAYHGEKIDPT